MSALPTLTPLPVVKIGTKRTLHIGRIGIAAGAVVVIAQCGTDPADGVTVMETHGMPTCEACIEKWGAVS